MRPMSAKHIVMFPQGGTNANRNSFLTRTQMDWAPYLAADDRFNQGFLDRPYA